MTNAADWQGDVGQSWAGMHAQLDRSFAGLTTRLLERIRPKPGEAVLDVGCGAGELSLAVARMRPRSRVIGIDLSPALIAAALGRGGQHGNAGRNDRFSGHHLPPAEKRQTADHP